MAYKPESIDQQAAGGIRVLVDAVDREVTRLHAAPEHHEASVALAQSWAALVRWLALDRAPATRPCPRCAKIVMLEATTCGYCWARLTPPN